VGEMTNEELKEELQSKRSAANEAFANVTKATEQLALAKKILQLAIDDQEAAFNNWMSAQ
jgi:hypothetical protein